MGPMLAPWTLLSGEETRSGCMLINRIFGAVRGIQLLLQYHWPPQTNYDITSDGPQTVNEYLSISVGYQSCRINSNTAYHIPRLIIIDSLFFVLLCVIICCYNIHSCGFMWEFPWLLLCTAISPILLPSGLVWLPTCQKYPRKIWVNVMFFWIIAYSPWRRCCRLAHLIWSDMKTSKSHDNNCRGLHPL